MCMDKKYEVKVTRQAMAQMKEIVHYISAELLAPEAANKLLDKMRDAIAALSFMPKKYALIEEEPWKHEGVRKIIVKNFLIYYWVDEENFKVQVIAAVLLTLSTTYRNYQTSIIRAYSIYVSIKFFHSFL